MKTVLDVLKKATALLSDPKKWTKGTEARSEKGNAVKPTSRNAVCFCAVGALERAAGGKTEVYDAAVTALNPELPFYNGFLASKKSIEVVNDQEPRGRLKVLKIFKNTIARLEKEAA
jgi:hypothetical protein